MTTSPVHEQPIARRFCTTCGLPAEQNKFCGGCGRALSPESTEVHSAVPAQPTGLREQDTVVLPQPATATGEPSEGSELLRDLIWQEDEPLPVQQAIAPARRLDRRKGAMAVGGLLVTGALIAGGIVGQQYMADGDIRRALASSTTDFNRVVGRLASAGDLQQFTTAADSADSAADGLKRVAGRLDGEDRMRAAVRAQIEAERSVLLAVAQLGALSSDPLRTWGAAHGDLTRAMAAERSSRDTLARLDSDAVLDIASTSPLMTRVGAAVGPALVKDATDESTRLLKSLESAKRTADLRKLGDAAAPEQVAVTAAAKALPDGDGKQVLTGYASALSALADLSKITPESTSGWASTRAELAQTFGQVAASAGTSGANVRVVLDGALNSSDKVVAAASAGMADWRAKTDAAVKARAASAEALSDYAMSFRAATKSYEQLRQDLSAHLERSEDPANGVTYNEDYQFLSVAMMERRAVRDQLVASDVPAQVEDAHAAVVAAIGRSISAVQAAYDGLEQSQDCYFAEDCTYYQDTPGWQRFLSESDGVSKSYTTARSSWDSAMVSAKAAIDRRSLPAKPDL